MLDDWRRFQQLAHVFHSGTICTIFFVRRHFKQGNACTVKGLIVALVVVVVVVHLSSSLQCSPWSQKRTYTRGAGLEERAIWTIF